MAESWQNRRQNNNRTGYADADAATLEAADAADAAAAADVDDEADAGGEGEQVDANEQPRRDNENADDVDAEQGVPRDWLKQKAEGEAAREQRQRRGRQAAVSAAKTAS